MLSDSISWKKLFSFGLKRKYFAFHLVTLVPLYTLVPAATLVPFFNFLFFWVTVLNKLIVKHHLAVQAMGHILSLSCKKSSTSRCSVKIFLISTGYFTLFQAPPHDFYERLKMLNFCLYGHLFVFLFAQPYSYIE